jgi:hypothetical protein
VIRFLSLSIACLALGQLAVADDTSEDGQLDTTAESVSRHRIDVGATFVDSLSADTLNGTFGYTYNLTSRSNFNVAVPYLDPDTSTGSNSGFGDVIVSLSYVPSTTISAHPWVPRTVGTGFAVLAPTGKASDGRSLDAWVVAPYVGLVVPLTKRFFLAPQVGYVHSLDKTVGGTDLRLAFAEVGVGFVAINGFWTSYFPQFVRDLETDEWAINHRFAIGKMLSKEFGISLDISLIERFNFGSNLPANSGFDNQIDVSAHFNF